MARSVESLVLIALVSYLAIWRTGEAIAYTTNLLGCPSDAYVTTGVIIDIETSTANGAKLIDGKYAGSLSACIQGCCAHMGCDLALFKVDGISTSGKNCYFIRCGRPMVCQMVAHEGFISATIPQAAVGECASFCLGCFVH